MTINTIIFDLDGTLVDSTVGILESLAFAFGEAGLQPTQALTSALIGPPLRETLINLCPAPHEAPIEHLITSFKAHYDTKGFLQTEPFPGIAEMLQTLATAEIPLHIATNKRSLPTSKILNTLGWASFFTSVLSPDSFSPPLSSKTEMLAKLLADVSINPGQCIYVGDRIDDYHAANRNSLRFGLANWGFEGNAEEMGDSVVYLTEPAASQLLAAFAPSA